MPTPLSAIVARTRTQILAPLVQTGAISPDLFWSDDELLAHTIAGCRDLWRALVDLHQEHFLTIDVTHVQYDAGSDSLTGVPADVLRVLMIQPRDTSSSGNRRLRFVPRRYTSTDFLRALGRDPFDATSPGDIFYAVVNAGSPVMAPSIYIAPTLTTTVLLRFVYVPTLPQAMDMTTMNPIPGESDHALMAWTASYALGKSGPDGLFSPDPTWLAVYATEKQAVMIISEPRQEQQPTVVQGVLDEFFGGGLSGDGSHNGGWD